MQASHLPPGFLLALVSNYKEIIHYPSYFYNISNWALKYQKLLLACHAQEKWNKEEIIERQKWPRSVRYSLWFITKEFLKRPSCHAPWTHTHSTSQKDNEGGKTAVCISRSASFFHDIYSHKNVFLYISMCTAILSPLDDTVSAQNPELEYQKPFRTGKVMWKKIAPASAQTIPVSCDFCTIWSGLLRPLNLNISAAARVVHVQCSWCEQSCRNDLCVYVYPVPPWFICLSL